MREEFNPEVKMIQDARVQRDANMNTGRAAIEKQMNEERKYEGNIDAQRKRDRVDKEVKYERKYNN